MNWYAVLTVSGEEEVLCETICKTLHYEAIFPRSQRHFRKQTQDLLVDKALYKGCVLVKADVDRNTLMYLLHSQTKHPIEHVEVMKSEDMELLQRLFSKNHRIDMSTGISVNHRAQVKTGPLVGMESYILKVNAHKRIAVLNVMIKGEPLLAGLEIKEKR